MRSSVALKYMSKNEKFDLLDKLWIDLGRNPTQLVLSDEQQRELDVRLDRLERDCSCGMSWNEVCLLARGQT
jgi:putative addiction module component (TIGR02574 family)